MFLACQIVGFNQKDDKLAKNHIFFIFGFDTGWKPAYNPQTRCSSVGEIVRHGQRKTSIRIGCNYSRKRCLKLLVCYERDSWAAMSLMSSCVKTVRLNEDLK